MTYTILQQPTPTCLTKLSTDEGTSPIIGLVDLDTVPPLRHNEARLGNLGRDAERSTCGVLTIPTVAETRACLL